VAVVAVTGADGFIGSVLCGVLSERGHRVIRIVRKELGPGTDRRVVTDLASAHALDAAVAGADVVVHLAARAHILRETHQDPEAAFRRANVDATARLVETAARAGVSRFVFVSSIGVNGNQTHGRPFTESDVPAPVEPYARSKLAAEQALRTVADRFAMETVIVRPPLVYGAGVKGNFLRLLSLVDRGVPLPLAAIDNRRNLIGVENLGELLALCVESREAAGEVFLAAEPEVHSTPQLLQAIAAAMGKPARLVNIPPGILCASARLLGLQGQFEKLCGSLEVSSERARRVLGWSPSVDFATGIARTVSWFQERGK
jgi:nucleoside-diphosphate-sugar epimerase